MGTYVCMYVCIYVCMYECMYACMYICVYVCMCVGVYVCMCVCVLVCMCVCMCVCVYVCWCVFVYSCNARPELLGPGSGCVLGRANGVCERGVCAYRIYSTALFKTVQLYFTTADTRG